MATRTREYQIRVSAVLTRGANAIGQELAAGMARARKDAEREAQKMGEGIRKSVKAGVDGADKELVRMKGSARQTYSEVEKLAMKVARDQERETVRAAKSTAREQAKEASRAAAEVAKAKREEMRAVQREENQAIAEGRKKLRDQYKAREDEAKRAAREEERSRREAERGRKREEAQIIADTRRQLREQTRYRQEEERKADRETKRKAQDELRDKRDKAREEARIARDNAREKAKYDRDLKTQTRRDEKEQKGREGKVREFASSAVGTFKGIAGKGMDVGREILAGTGVNFDISSAVNKGIKLESLAVAISNAGSKLVEKVDPTTGIKQNVVQRESVGGLVSMARDIGQKYAFDPSQVLEGLSKYQAKTGDLGTAKAGIEELAMLAKATSTDLQDMVDAAGDVGTAIGEVGDKFKTPQEKAAAVQKIMRVIAAQGAVGAVEIKDLSVQMAKLASASQAFEGNADENLQFMGALAQLSRQKGGSASATQAATSVASFVSMLKTPARMKEFEEQTGEKIYDEKSGFLRDPKWIIEKALMATMGNPEQLKKIFANVQGARAVEGSATTFREGMAEARAKGMTKDEDIKAYAIGKVRDEFSKFGQAASEQKLQDDLKTSMESKESRAQLFQNQLEKIVASMADKVLPQMEKLGPKVLEVVEALSKIVSWAAQNPGQAITAAIVASIGKAAIGSVVGNVLEKLVSGAASAGGGVVGLGGGAGKLLGQAVPVAAAGALGFGLGTLITDGIAWSEKQATQGGNQAASRDMRVFGTTSALNAAAVSGKDEDIDRELANAESVRKQLAMDIEKAKDPTSYVGAIFSGTSIEDAGKQQADAQRLPELNAMMERLSTAIETLTRKRLKVDADITSMPMTPMPGGRSGISG